MEIKIQEAKIQENLKLAGREIHCVRTFYTL